jgi:transposase
MISAVTARGALRFAVYDATLTAKVFIDFCKRLLHDAPGPVFLILDGHPAHRAAATKQFVAGTEGRLRLFCPPGYSSELNSDEGVWKNVKHDRIGRAGITSADDLKTKAIGALRRLQKLPHLVRGFFADPRLAYTPPLTQSTYRRLLGKPGHHEQRQSLASSVRTTHRAAAQWQYAPTPARPPQFR